MEHTVDEMIQALRCCVFNQYPYTCKTCPYSNDGRPHYFAIMECQEVLKEDVDKALGLIESKM